MILQSCKELDVCNVKMYCAPPPPPPGGRAEPSALNVRCADRLQQRLTQSLDSEELRRRSPLSVVGHKILVKQH